MAKAEKKNINLALQGGGAHGAFTWGVLDYLLEDGRFNFEGVSATSAGAMNAIVLAQGLLNNDYDEARQALHDFWHAISQAGDKVNPFRALPVPPWLQGEHFSLDHSPLYQMSEMVTRVFSPYQLNPTNYNPLKELLEKMIDFDQIKKCAPLNLNICATNVEKCKIRIFKCADISVDAVLASACLPFLYQAVEIDGEHYWDGGYMGNPAVYPLIYSCKSSDVVVVHINPINRPGVPTSAPDILNRINEISFNSSLMREMRAVAFVSKLIEQGKIKKDEMKDMRIHSIRSDEIMSDYSVSSKLNTDWEFLQHLFDEGRHVAKEWADAHYDKVGKSSSVDIRGEFL